MKEERFDLYKLHIPEYDNQHKALFDQIDVLYSLYKEQRYENINLEVVKLKELLFDHLVDEEKFMEDINFPYFEYHKASHVAFRREITDIVNKVLANDMKYSFALHTFEETFLKHVDHYDTQYAHWYKYERNKN